MTHSSQTRSTATIVSALVIAIWTALQVLAVLPLGTRELRPPDSILVYVNHVTRRYCCGVSESIDTITIDKKFVSRALRGGYDTRSTYAEARDALHYQEDQDCARLGCFIETVSLNDCIWNRLLGRRFVLRWEEGWGWTTGLHQTSFYENGEPEYPEPRFAVRTTDR